MRIYWRINWLIKWQTARRWSLVFRSVQLAMGRVKFFRETRFSMLCNTHTHAHAHAHTRTHNRLTAFVRDNPGRPVPEETLTHSHPTWSSDILYHLPPFTTIHGILFVHFTCLTILSDNLSPGPLWSSSFSMLCNGFWNSLPKTVLSAVVTLLQF